MGKVWIFGLAVAFAVTACSQERSKEAESEAAVSEPAPAPTEEAEEVAPINENIGPAYAGRWAGEGANCRLTPGAGDGAPIAFTESEFIADSNNCVIAVAEETAPLSWSMELVCIGSDGIEDLEQISLVVENNALSITKAGKTSVFARCN